jgi:putative tryptophan/tyrosine transport system substrate-binding protein
MTIAASPSILVAVIVLAVAVVAEAQQSGKIRRIGFLAVNTPSADKHLDEAFKQSLRELGWIEGRNITIEYRSAEGNADRLPALAAELVDSKVDVIVSAGGTPGAQAVKKATGTIPIVFTSSGDPVATVSSPASLGPVVTLRDSAALVPI